MVPNVSRQQDKQSFGYVVRSGLAGGIAGCIAKTVVAPLDRVKILFQASNPDFQKYAGTWSGAFRAGAEIYRTAGARGLLQGHSATLLRVFPYAGIKFMAYEQAHHVLMPTRERETSARRFAAGAISGIVSVLVTYPLELVRVRLAFQTRSLAAAGAPHARPTLRSAAAAIYHEGARTPAGAGAAAHIFARAPLLSFYRGFGVTLLGMVPYAGTSFLVWGGLRARLRRGRAPRATPVADLAVGALAGAVAQTVAYPAEVVRRRMQVGGLTHPGRWVRLGETARAIWARAGWRGFFVGLSIGYLKVVPMTAVSYAAWDSGKRLLAM